MLSKDREEAAALVAKDSDAVCHLLVVHVHGPGDIDFNGEPARAAHQRSGVILNIADALKFRWPRPHVGVDVVLHAPPEVGIGDAAHALRRGVPG